MSVTRPVHRERPVGAPKPTPQQPDCGNTRSYSERVKARDRLYTAASALDERCGMELHSAIALPTHLTAHQLDDIQRVAAWLRGKAEKLNEQLERECKHGNPSEPRDGQQTTFATWR